MDRSSARRLATAVHELDVATAMLLQFPDRPAAAKRYLKAVGEHDKTVKSMQYELWIEARDAARQ